MTAQPRPAPAPPLRVVPQKRAAIYARVSDPKQEANYSLPTQEAALRAYCAAQGYTLAEAHVYREVHTASELWQRPALAEVRAALDRGELDVLVCYDPDRFSRKQVHSALLQDICERAGAELKFAMFDYSRDATGQFLLNARVFAAELEREKIIERTARGMLARVKSGKLRPSPRPLYGYRWADASKSCYIIDEAAAAIVRRIFAAIAGGMSIRAMAKLLNDEGAPTPTGGPRWGHTTIRHIVTHPSYTGVAVANQYRSIKVPGKRSFRREARPVDEHVSLPEGTIPPLVSEATAAAAVAMLARNKATAVRNNKRPEAFLLRAGFIRCGYCGKPITCGWHYGKQARTPLYRNRDSGDWHAGCPGCAISAELIDADVWRHVEAILTRPDLIAHELGRLRTGDPTAGDLGTCDRALLAAQRRIKNLVGTLSLFDDLDLAAPVVAEIQQWRQRERDLEREREAILARQESWARAERRLDGLASWCETVAANLTGVTYQEKRDALLALGVQVRLYRSDHEPRYEITASIPLGDGEEVVDRCASTSSATWRGSRGSSAGSR
jgi:site-specific DNA recombinase